MVTSKGWPMPSLRFRYQTLEFGDTDIHVRTLRDRQQFLDGQGIAERLGISSATWPLFGIIWDSGRILSKLMQSHEIGGKRILEVGCGIGLASLLLNTRHADITATDYHPEAGSFLCENVKLNRGERIPFERTGWGDDNDTLGKFDLIIGSDLLYEQEHAMQLSTFIDNHAKAQCEVIIVDPGRGQRGRFTRQMIERGYLHSISEPEKSDLLPATATCRILYYDR
jgi:ETFB lysine methyltransferase